MSTTPPLVNLDPTLDPSQLAAFVNQNFQSVQNSLNPIIISDGTNNRIILGKQPDGTYGLKISQSGVDVSTATNSQLIFNSSQNVFKIVTATTTTHTIPNPLGSGSTDTKTIAHGLGYIPTFEVYIVSGDSLVVDQNTYYKLPFIRPVNIAGTWQPGLRILARSDATNLYIDVTNFTGSGLADINTFTYKYYLMQETAN